jgi:uncharacterized protein (TIGR03545 family)
MKNSTDKPVKKQGPIRFEAIVPLAIVVGLIAAYFSLFFDSHLRRGLEYAATQANGAEVDIGRVKTSVFDASVLIADVQMTDPELPQQNRVQIGEMRFRMLWDVLLRGKIMIDEAVIEDVQVATARQRAGYVLPPEPEQTDEGPSATDKMLAQLKQEFSGNVVGDLAAIAGGADPAAQLKEAGELKSSARLDSLKQSQDDAELQWRKQLDELPDSKDYQALRERLGKVKLKDFRDVSEVQASLQELRAIRDEFDAKAGPVGEAGSRLKGDMGALRSSFAELEKVAQEDVRALQARMRLPSLDATTLSRSLFGMDVLGKLQQGKGYMEQAREYLPARGAKKAAPKKIHKGRDYAFGTSKSYPLFWLRRAAVSTTRPDKSGLSGEILDVATDQVLVGRPMRALLKGDFPQQGVSGVKAELVIDHRGDEPVERLELGVARYAMAGRPLVQSESVTLGFARAEAGSGVLAELRGDKVDMRFTTRFSQVAFETSASSPLVREMMAASVAGLDRVGMEARVSGTWSDLDFMLSSDLGDALVRGMGRYLQARMDEAKKRIQAMVDARIGEQRQRLLARQNELESRFRSALAERQAQVDKLRTELDGARNELEKRKNTAVDSQKQKLKQEAGKLLDQWRR